MNEKLNQGLYASMIAAAVFAASCASKKHASQQVTLKTTSTPGGGSSASATLGGPAKKEGIKKFSDIITPKTKVDKGLFNTYKVDGKYYYEIPDSLLNREMLVVTRFVKTPANLKTFGSQYGGEEVNDQVWKW